MASHTDQQMKRPSPEALLAQVKTENRGRLKIFLGAAPGVGKTYEMLTSGTQLRQQGVDVVIVEIGGTVGDIESLPFLEAIRQMRLELGTENTLFVHVTLVPYIATAGELKTKPTQHSVRDLREI